MCKVANESCGWKLSNIMKVCHKVESWLSTFGEPNSSPHIDFVKQSLLELIYLSLYSLK